MCGIGGIWLKQKCSISIQSTLQKMVNIQDHRGPDSNNIWLDNNRGIGLCHNRLAIIDLSKDANQPMDSSCGRFTIVFNGEIYNYKELKKELVSKECFFLSNSDTEVIVEGYKLWGKEILNRLEGMFSFCIYDKQKNLFFCARDYLGKKPFVYCQNKDYFAFASEIPSLKAIEGLNVTIDKDAIASMLIHNLKHICDPFTAFNEIKRLKPAHAMIIAKGEIIEIWNYWKPAQKSFENHIDKLREYLSKSVYLRTRADVPFAALLSGGVDSSAIVSLTQRIRKVKINTYALGLNDKDQDILRARKIAKKLGTNHKEFFFDPQKQWLELDKLICMYGEPIMLLPLTHCSYLCEQIKKDGIKVVLNGNGADELFYGYTGHIRTQKISRLIKYVRKLKFLNFILNKTRYSWVFSKKGHTKGNFYESMAKSTWQKILSEDYINSLNFYPSKEMNFWGELCPSSEVIDESNFISLMLESSHSITTIADLAGMANSIELRSPFLDKELIEFAFNLPSSEKIIKSEKEYELKSILKKSVSPYIPDEVLSYSKIGFGMGIKQNDLFACEWKENISDLFQNFDDIDGLFNKDKAIELWNKFLVNKKNSDLIGKLISIQLWYRNIDGTF